jgi:hypothetical protein
VFIPKLKSERKISGIGLGRRPRQQTVFDVPESRPIQLNDMIREGNPPVTADLQHNTASQQKVC